MVQHQTGRVIDTGEQINAPADPLQVTAAYRAAEQRREGIVRQFRQDGAQVIRREQVVFRVGQGGKPVVELSQRLHFGYWVNRKLQ